MATVNLIYTWIPSHFPSLWPDFYSSHLSWAVTRSLQGQNKYLLDKSLEALPKVGDVGNKEAITENKVTAAVETEKLYYIPPFLLITPPRKGRLCFSVPKLKKQYTFGYFCFHKSK